MVLEGVTKEFPFHSGIFSHQRHISDQVGQRALNNISFELKPGDVLGIIGHNGSGKSTLLRIISGILPPTHGTVRYSGTLGSILDVGTGFHPDLSGTENVYLSCKIHGLTKRQVDSLFRSILEFSEIGNYIHLPVKYYSSGMYLKLAFAIILHIDVDILLIDEVLNVGDASFRFKCTQKVEELIARGKIAIISSHDLASISKLCNKCLVLEKGEVKHFGETQIVLQNYMESVVIKNVEDIRKSREIEVEQEVMVEEAFVKPEENTLEPVEEIEVKPEMDSVPQVPDDNATLTESPLPVGLPSPAAVSKYHSNTDLFKNSQVHVKALKIVSAEEHHTDELYIGEQLQVELVFEKFDPIAEVDFMLVLKDYLYMPVFLLNTRMVDKNLIPAATGIFKIVFTLPKPFLNKGFFTVDLIVVNRENNLLLKECVNALVFHIHYNDNFYRKYGGGKEFPGPLMPKFDIEISMVPS